MSEQVEIEVSDWWCPSKQRWSWCPGPCPDGTPHGPERRQMRLARRITAEEASTLGGRRDS